MLPLYESILRNPAHAASSIPQMFHDPTNSNSQHLKRNETVLIDYGPSREKLSRLQAIRLCTRATTLRFLPFQGVPFLLFSELAASFSQRFSSNLQRSVGSLYSLPLGEGSKGYVQSHIDVLTPPVFVEKRAGGAGPATRQRHVTRTTTQKSLLLRIHTVFGVPLQVHEALP